MLSPRSLSEARAVQERLRSEVRLVPIPLSRVRLVGAADATFLGKKDEIAAAVTVYDTASGMLVEESTAVAHASFPYVPGYLSFREGPAIAAAWRALRRKPDVLLCDGHGIAHPRRFGIASHLGVVLDVPTVGCAKERLVGECCEPGRRRESVRRLVHEGEVVGAALRTRDGVKPVFVSPGHRADLPTSVSLVLSLCTRYRLPEPAREAHRLTREMRRMAG